MARCKMVREFADGTVERCCRETWNHDDEYDYLCQKYADGLTYPIGLNEDNQRRVVKLKHIESGKVIWDEKDRYKNG